MSVTLKRQVSRVGAQALLGYEDGAVLEHVAMPAAHVVCQHL